MYVIVKHTLSFRFVGAFYICICLPFFFCSFLIWNLSDVHTWYLCFAKITPPLSYVHGFFFSYLSLHHWRKCNKDTSFSSSLLHLLWLLFSLSPRSTAPFFKKITANKFLGLFFFVFVSYDTYFGAGGGGGKIECYISPAEISLQGEKVRKFNCGISIPGLWQLVFQSLIVHTIRP